MIQLPITTQPYECRICLTLSLVAWTCTPTARFAYPTASPHRSNNHRWYRNIYLLSIAYAYRPRLRSRLTQSGRAFLWKPWSIGGWDSHPSFATHTGILTSKHSTCPCDHASTRLERSPTIILTDNPQLR